MEKTMEKIVALSKARGFFRLQTAVRGCVGEYYNPDGLRWQV